MKNKTLYLLFSLVLMCWVMTFTGCASAPAPHVSEADFDNDVWSSVWPDNSDLEEGAMGVRISELSAFSGTVADADELIFNDYSETPSTRRITAANLFAYPANATQAELAGFAANPLSIPEFDNVQWASFIDITDLESADLIDFTKDADKPVSTAQAAAIAQKAPAWGITSSSTTAYGVANAPISVAAGEDYIFQCWVRIPTSNPSSAVTFGGLRDSDGAVPNQFTSGAINTSGQLLSSLRDDSNSLVQYTGPNIVSTHGGKVVHIAFGRQNGGTFYFQLNGDDITSQFSVSSGVEATYANAVSSRYPAFYGAVNSLRDYAMIRGFTLSATELSDLYDLGSFGAWLNKYPQYKKADDGPVYSLDASGATPSEVTSNNGPLVSNVDGVSDGTTSKDDCLSYTPNAGLNNFFLKFFISGLTGTMRSGDAVIISFDYLLPNTNTVMDGFGVTDDSTSKTYSAPAIRTLGVWTTFSLTTTVSTADQGLRIRLADGGNYSAAPNGADLIYITNLQIQHVGAQGHWPADEGIGRQLHDTTGNNLDLLLSTSGWSHLLKKDWGYLRSYALDASANDYVASSTTDTIPTDCVITDVQIVDQGSEASTGLTAQLSDGTNHNGLHTGVSLSADAAISVPATAEQITTDRRVRMATTTGGTNVDVRVNFKKLNSN